MTIDDYVEEYSDWYRIRGTGVCLDSLVYRFLEGLSPESIQADCFPVLTLEQVYGAIAYYLHNRTDIDAYLKKADQEYELFRQRLRTEYPEAHRRLDALVQDATADRR